MSNKIYLVSSIFLLGLLLVVVVRQVTAHYYWTRANQDWEELEKTIVYLRKCIEMDGNNSQFHFSLGRAYLRKGLAKTKNREEKNKWIIQSIGEFHRALDLEPSNSDYHFHIGLAYGCLDYPPSFSWTVIESSFKRTAMLNPTDIRHLHLIGTYYLDEHRRLKSIRMKMDDIGLVIHENQELLLKDCSQLYFGLKRIRILLDEGRLDEAIDEYHTIVKKHPKFSKSLYDMIRYYQKKKNYPRAISILNEAIASILY